MVELHRFGFVIAVPPGFGGPREVRQQNSCKYNKTFLTHFAFPVALVANVNYISLQVNKIQLDLKWKSHGSVE
jgi:hypothetical protein